LLKISEAVMKELFIFYPATLKSHLTPLIKKRFKKTEIMAHTKKLNSTYENIKGALSIR